jgi:hypothetical protein
MTDDNKVKMISLKRLVGAQKPPAAGSTVWLCAVFGCVTTIKQRTGADALPETRFGGDFMAKTMVPVGRENEVRAAQSSELSLPNNIEEQLLADGVGEEGTFTQLGFKIGITADDKGRAGYVMEYLLKPTQTSPASAIVKEHGGDLFNAPATAQQAPKAAPPVPGKGGKR